MAPSLPENKAIAIGCWSRSAFARRVTGCTRADACQCAFPCKGLRRERPLECLDRDGDRGHHGGSSRHEGFEEDPPPRTLLEAIEERGVRLRSLFWFPRKGRSLEAGE